MKPYNECNMKNIFESEILANKPPLSDNNRRSTDTDKPINLIITNLHIRFEDDYYSSKPYSFGILIDEFKVTTGNLRRVFNSFD